MSCLASFEMMVDTLPKKDQILPVIHEITIVKIKMIIKVDSCA